MRCIDLTYTLNRPSRLNRPKVDLAEMPLAIVGPQSDSVWT
jgi:hypothetical protein